MGHWISNKSTNIITKTKTITYYHPKNTYYPCCYHTFDHGREHILSVNHAAVEKGQTWSHQKNQGGGNNNPCHIGCIIFTGIRKVNNWFNKTCKNCNRR